MNIYPITIVLLLALFPFVSCQQGVKETETELKSQVSMSMGIFKTYLNIGKTLHFDTIQQTYRFEADTSNTLRYLSMPIEGDFLLEVKLETHSTEGEYGFLLTADDKGEQPIATLQIMNSKVVFGPAGLVNESFGHKIDVEYLKLERIGSKLVAYYCSPGGKFKPLAAQQLPIGTTIHGGLFAKNIKEAVVFSNMNLSKPETTALN